MLQRSSLSPRRFLGQDPGLRNILEPPQLSRLHCLELTVYICVQCRVKRVNADWVMTKVKQGPGVKQIQGVFYGQEIQNISLRNYQKGPLFKIPEIKMTSCGNLWIL